MIKKGRLKEIVKELRAASKMHAGQADEISEHIDDMGPKMECWDTHKKAGLQDSPSGVKTASGALKRVNKCVPK